MNKMDILAELKRIGVAPKDQRYQMVVELIGGDVHLREIVPVARDHREDPDVSGSFLALKEYLLNPPPPPLTQLGAVAE